MTMLFSIPQPALSIVGSSIQKFPLRRIYCIGRNFGEHALEMGHSDREPPFWFTKPPDAVTESKHIPYPSKTNNLHYEGELVVALHKRGRNLSSPQQARDLIFGYGVGCDLTRRDLQAEAKTMGRPWDAAKGFDSSAPMSPIIMATTTADWEPSKLDLLELQVNGTTRQSATLGSMIWSVDETIVYLSQHYTLEAGDLIMMGTPAGVGPLEVGDEVRVSCGEVIPPCEFTIESSEQ